MIGVDDFALRRRHSYATIIINAETGQRVEVLPGREAATLEAWLRGHPGIETVCRDGSATYAEAVRRALPDAIQISDRWHLWHNLAEAVRKEVAAHSICWAKAGPPPAEGRQAATTRERWQQVHILRERGVGLLECARRLNPALNTVKRYDRVAEPERLIRAPEYRPTLVDPYRDHLRQRRLEDPAVPVTHLLQEIRELGYTGSSNLLVRYINPGRVEADRPALSPRRLARYLLTRPDRLKDHQRECSETARTACQEMTALADLIHGFAALLEPADGNAALLSTWITAAQTEDLPHLHAFTRGLERDRAAVDAALTLPHHNGGTEGVNNKTKLIKRQMYGRASFPLLRHRILLG